VLWLLDVSPDLMHQNSNTGCKAALEGTCQEKMRTALTKTQENVLAHGKKIGPIDTQ
jgi:hypothetical protein